MYIARHALRSVVPVVCLAGLVTATVRADIVSVGGSAVVATPPANITVGHWSSDTEARVWFESLTTSNASIQVDAVSTGTVFQNGTVGTPGTIPVGLPIVSYMLRTESASTGGVLFTGFIVFDQPVLGILFRHDTLESSDAALARSNVSYNHNSDRGLEVHQPPNQNYDALFLSADRLRVDFAFDTFSGTDDVRIITAVPAPACLPMLTLVGALGRRRRDAIC